MNRDRIGSLDSMRGVAATVVLLGHAVALSPFADRQDTRALEIVRKVVVRLLDSAAAVDFFFVLSGFVLALPYLDARKRPLAFTDFIARRVLRIVPTFWASLAVTCLVHTITAPYVRSLPRSLGIADAVPFTWVGLARLSTLFMESKLIAVNGPIWSLNIEMRMSLLLPFVVAQLLWNTNRFSSVAIVAVWWVTVAIVGGPSGFGFFPLFVLGAVLAQELPGAVGWVGRASAGRRLCLWLLTASLIYNRALQQFWVFPDMGQEYLSGVGSALAIALVIARPSKLLESRLSRFGGDVSYSLYLMHLPLLVGAMAVFNGPLGWSLGASATIGTALAVLGSIGLYFAVERPSIDLGRRVMARWNGR